MTVGSLGWYLDISEYADSGMLRNSYSIPLPFDIDQVLSVGEFVAGFNAAFSAHAVAVEQAGETPRIYNLTATLVDVHRGGSVHSNTPGSFIGETYLGAGVTVGGASFAPDELSIGYVITAQAGLAEDTQNLFEINFVTGPHGSTGNFLQLGGEIGGEVEIYNYPTTNVGSFPFYSKAVTVQDNPPTTPHVEIIPYRGVNDRILILVNGTGGTYYEKPIIIEDIDAEHFINAYMAQGAQFAPEATETEKLEIVKNSDILFRSDDPTVEYQMFRTDVAPSSYQDFAEGEKTDIIEYVGEDQISTLATHTDIIRPNTKYYYCFRAIDVHGHLSNPTPVFQVEMIDNNGQIYPIIESYKFESAKQLSLTKGAKRFIYISPSTRQVYFEPEDTFEAEVGTAPSPMPLLGMVDGVAPGSRVWNGIYKIRLTSKKTGRKLDLNIIFKNTGQDNP